MKRLIILSSLILMAVATWVPVIQAEEVKLTTIIPDQIFVQGKKGVIGEGYAGYLHDPLKTVLHENIPANGLIVEGSVGVRTASPGLPLDARGTPGTPATSGSTQTSGSLRLRTNTSNSQTLDMGLYNSSPMGAWLQAADSNSLSAYSLLALNPNGGNVGIGTAAPANKLVVKADNGEGIDILRGPGANANRLLFKDGSNLVGDLCLSYLNSQIELIARAGKRIVLMSNGGAIGGVALTAGDMANVGFHLFNSIGGSGVDWSLQSTGNNEPNNPVSVYGIGKLAFTTGANGGTAPGIMVFQPNGWIGIGKTAPGMQLDLSTDSARKLSTTTWTTSSDVRLKKDIRPFTDGLNVISRINPVWFKWNGKAGHADDGKDHIGIIGQEIEKIAPYTIIRTKAKLEPTDKNETELIDFTSHALIFNLVNAVKEQQKEISERQEKIKTLKARIAALESKK